MIIVLLILLGVVLGVVGSEAARRATASAHNPMLDGLRHKLEEMERDYRLRVATEELTRDTAPVLPIRPVLPREDGPPTGPRW
jgi:hypothetical protein